MKWLRQHDKFLIISLLLIVNIFVYYLLYFSTHKGLVVSFLDIGQGDSVFIQTPSGKDILIDGGPNKNVLKELGGIVSFFDKKIDIVLATHPDKDHIGGLPAVFERFNVGLFIESGVECSTSICDALASSIKEKKIDVIKGRRGTVIDFGDGVYISILFPDRDVADLETNTASVATKIVYGKNSVILSGDSPQSIEDFLVWKDGKNLDSDILKVGHHGSRTSSGEEFVHMVSPAIAIISAGKGNSYGHPHKEVVDILNKEGSKMLSTIDMGRITLVSDGKSWKTE